MRAGAAGEGSPERGGGACDTGLSGLHRAVSQDVGMSDAAASGHQGAALLRGPDSRGSGFSQGPGAGREWSAETASLAPRSCSGALASSPAAMCARAHGTSAPACQPGGGGNTDAPCPSCLLRPQLTRGGGRAGPPRQRTQTPGASPGTGCRGHVLGRGQKPETRVAGPWVRVAHPVGTGSCAALVRLQSAGPGRPAGHGARWPGLS